MRLAVGMSCLFFILGLNVRLSAQPAFLGPFSTLVLRGASSKARKRSKHSRSSLLHSRKIGRCNIGRPSSRPRWPAKKPRLIDRR